MRGRPCRSKIRENILSIVAVVKKAYGYEIYQHYLNLFQKVHVRSIYYHLKKGVALNELEVHEIKEEKGEYSWGEHAEKIYYTLGNKAKVKKKKRVETYFKASSKNP